MLLFIKMNLLNKYKKYYIFNKMTHIHYNITSTHVNKDCPGDSLYIHDVSKKEKEEIPGWMHINPIST